MCNILYSNLPIPFFFYIFKFNKYAMKYTLDYLYDHNIDSAMVIYQNGDYDFFDDIQRGILEYARYLDVMNGNSEAYSATGKYQLNPSECTVLVYPMYADNTPREDETLCDVEMFLDVLNSGNKVKFNVDFPF